MPWHVARNDMPADMLFRLPVRPGRGWRLPFLRRPVLRAASRRKTPSRASCNQGEGGGFIGIRDYIFRGASSSVTRRRAPFTTSRSSRCHVQSRKIRVGIWRCGTRVAADVVMRW